MATKKYKVLVAEDEEINFLYIEALFKNPPRHDYTLIHALNGKEAVDICSKDHDIKLILMDIRMPLMDGYEATKKIKSEFPQIPVIAQTAFSTQTDKDLAFQYGCDGFITKPLNKEKLFELVEQHLKV